VIPDNTFYTQVTPEDAEEIVAEHILKGRRVSRLLYEDPETKEHVSDSKHMGFYQNKWGLPWGIAVLLIRKNWRIHRQRWLFRFGTGDYRAHSGSGHRYAQAERTERKRWSRFPRRFKMGIYQNYTADQKYVVCNADEGDPGAFMDRSILEGDPNSVIEAMAICGYCIGANKVWYISVLNIRWPFIVAGCHWAANEYGLLGKNILGTDFSFEMELRYGAGALFVEKRQRWLHRWKAVGESPTLNLLSRPNPATTKTYLREQRRNVCKRPGYLFERTRMVSSIGTEKSKGTKVFALAGKSTT